MQHEDQQHNEACDQHIGLEPTILHPGQIYTTRQIVTSLRRPGAHIQGKLAAITQASHRHQRLGAHVELKRNRRPHFRYDVRPLKQTHTASDNCCIYPPCKEQTCRGKTRHKDLAHDGHGAANS